MEMLGPVGPVPMSGTYTGHLSAILAALESLAIMSEPGFFERLNAVAHRLYTGFDGLFEASGVPGHVQGLGARFGIFFGVEEWARGRGIAPGERLF